MKTAEDMLIRRAAGAIVIISSLIIISLMITGGCNNRPGGDDTVPVDPTPTPTQPHTTGFPSECDGTFGVSLSCPATSLAGSVCLPYNCDIIDDSTENPEIVDSIQTVFGDSCTDIDCFTLECQDISVVTATIIIESVNGIPVGEDVEGVENSGLPDGRIIIDGQDFLLDCNGITVP